MKDGRREELDWSKELAVEKAGEYFDEETGAVVRLVKVGTSSFRREMRRPKEFRPSMAL